MIKLLLHLEVGQCNGVMNMQIKDRHDKDYAIGSLTEGRNTVELNVPTPNKLIINLAGKQGRDTILDKNTSKILKDKFIKVTGVEIDGKPLDANRVAQMFVLETEANKRINSAFWGFNGHVNFDLPYKDALDLHLINLG